MNFFKFNRTIQIRLVLQFLTGLAAMAVMPYLAIYFDEQVGKVATGIMFILVIITGIIGGLIGGHWSDLIGRKKILVVSEGIAFAGFILAAIFNSPWLTMPYLTFAVFLGITFCEGMVGPTSQALIIDATTPEERKGIFGFSYWVNNLGTAVGGLVGAFLFSSHLFALFIIVGMMLLVSSVVTAFFVKETFVPEPVHESEAHKPPVSMLKSYLNILSNKIFLIFIIGSLMLQSMEEQLTQYTGIRLAHDFHPQKLIDGFSVNGVKMLGFLRVENNIIVVALAVVVMMIIKKYKDATAFQIGALFFVGGYVFMSYSLSPWLLLIAMFITTIGELMNFPIKQALLTNIIPDNARSSYMAVYGMNYYISAILASGYIILSKFLPPFAMTGVLLVVGVTSMILFQSVFNYEHRVHSQKAAG